MTQWWYWLAFWFLAGLLFIGIPFAAWLERRADERDREAWERQWRR